LTEVRIPTGFILGVATSAYQIEGASEEHGKGESIWDTFSRTPGKVHGDISGDRGVEHVQRVEEDIAIMRDLGVDSYRFSLSWPRLIPTGQGPLNPGATAFYDRLIDGLLSAGITPNVTLYHWDLPQALQDRGGWANREIVEWFAEYARAVFDHFGDRVSMWVTLNEPIALWVGYGLGVFAPGISDRRVGKQALHHAMLAHGRAVQEFRRSGGSGKIGIVIDVWTRHPAKDTRENRALVVREEDETFRFFFDQLFAGGLSDRILEQLKHEETLPVIENGDRELASEPFDFLGLNVYSRVIVDATKPKGHWWESNETLPGGNYLSNGAELYPDALLEAVRIVRDEYGVRLPIYITENGTTADGEMRDGVQDDEERIRYIAAFLKEAVDAHNNGLGVMGYYVWSLLDNYEWAAGYSMRYGLVRVDPETFDRTYKRSARWYRNVNHSRRFEVNGS
jgi:beta-glucosidase